jgi:hypothetical protein
MENTETYKNNPNKPVLMEKFGKCPICNCEFSKIMWGWNNIYYDMLCENGHEWTYKFDNSTQNAV